MKTDIGPQATLLYSDIFLTHLPINCDQVLDAVTNSYSYPTEVSKALGKDLMDYCCLVLYGL